MLAGIPLALTLAALLPLASPPATPEDRAAGPPWVDLAPDVDDGASTGSATPEEGPPGGAGARRPGRRKIEDAQRRLGVVLNLLKTDGFSAGLRAGSRPAGIEVTAGVLPILMLDNLGGAEGGLSAQVSARAYVVGGVPAFSAGAKVGYQYNNVLGSGFTAAFTGQSDIGRAPLGYDAKAVFAWTIGVVVHPRADEGVAEFFRLGDNEVLTSSLKVGPAIGIGFIFYP